MRRVAVVGATGFIGSSIVDLLLQEDETEVTALVRDPRKAHPLRRRGVSIAEVDLGEGDGLDRALAGHRIVINTVHDFHASAAANIRSLDVLLDACVRQGVECIVHLSSIVVYDEWPTGAIDESSSRSATGDAYRRAKVAMEQMLEGRAAAGEIASRVLEPTIVYGPGGWIWTDSDSRATGERYGRASRGVRGKLPRRVC